MLECVFLSWGIVSMEIEMGGYWHYMYHGHSVRPAAAGVVTRQYATWKTLKMATEDDKNARKLTQANET